MEERTQQVMSSFWTERLARLREQMKREDLGGVLIVDRRIQFWLGYEEVSAVLVSDSEVVPIAGRLPRALTTYLPRQLGLDNELTAEQLEAIRERYPMVKFQPFSKHLANLMSVKDKVERLLLERAAGVARQVFKTIETVLRPGCSELDVLYCAYRTLIQNGANGFSFEPSIAFGERTLLTWAGLTTRTLQEHDPILIDIGVSFRGYHSDVTRAYFGGATSQSASSEWRTAKRVVNESRERILNAIRPGVKGCELHAIYEQCLERSGFPGAMANSLGHGIGLYLHEPPFLTPGSQDVLREGMVVCIEPGIRTRDFGVRHEDVVLVTADGSCVLT